MSVVGLDIGTANLRAAVLRDGVATLVADGAGATSFPAAVAMQHGRVHVGGPAAKLQKTDPAAVVWGAKRLLGGGQVALGGYAMTPEQVVGVMLRHLSGLATKQLGSPPSSAVLCAPVWFRPEQQAMLSKAAELAKLTVASTVLEPTAIAFHLSQAQVQAAEFQRLGVVDIGAAGVSVGIYVVGGGTVELLGSGGVERREEGQAALLGYLEECCRQALLVAALPLDDLSVVYATGGGAHTAAARQQVRSVFGRRVVAIRSEGSVALGAALLGGVLTGAFIAPVDDATAAEAAPSSSRGEALGSPPSSRGGGQQPAPSSARVQAPSGPPSSQGGEEPAPSSARVQVLGAPPSSQGGEPAPPSSLPGLSRPPQSTVSFGNVLSGSHQVRHPTEAAGMLDLALSRKPTAADFDPVALPVLFIWVLRRKTTTGTLTVTHGEGTAQLMVEGGAAYVSTGERKALMTACAWPEATYTFDETPPQPGTRISVPLQRLAADGLRALGRTFMPAELAAALGDKLDLAPIPRPEARRQIPRLGLESREVRLVQTTIDGHDSAREITRHGGAGEHTTLMLFILLTAFGCVDWKPPVVRKGQSLAEQLEVQAHQMRKANHFDALSVHWSAQTEEIQQVYAKLQGQLAPGGRWMKAAPEACAVMAQRAREAYEVISDPAQRAKYRLEKYPNQDSDSLDDLLEKRISALGMKVHGQEEQRLAMARRAELRKSFGAPGRGPAVRPKGEPPSRSGGGGGQ